LHRAPVGALFFSRHGKAGHVEPQGFSRSQKSENCCEMAGVCPGLPVP